MDLSKFRLEACVREIDTWMLLNTLKLNKDKTKLLMISSLHPPCSTSFVTYSCLLIRELWLHQERETLEFSSTNLCVWLLRCSPLSIISVKLGSFVNISPSMQPSFLFKLLLHQSLTTVIRYYMVYMSKWLNSSNVCRTQLLVLLLFRPSSVILNLFLRIFTGSGLNLKYLLLPTRLSMDLLLLILKIFFKVSSRQVISGLQSINQSIIYFNTLRQRAKKLVQNANS